MQLDVDIIRRAKAGCPYAQKYIQEYYSGYIESLSVVLSITPEGATVQHYDHELREELLLAVIEGTLKFDLERGIDNGSH